jgi:hypothetical protein
VDVTGASLIAAALVGLSPAAPLQAAPATVSATAPATATASATPEPGAVPRPATTPQSEAAADALARVINRPHTIAELEAGIITLPTAPISASQRGGDTPFLGKVGSGDATINLGIHVLYRWNESFAVGATGAFAPAPTGDNQYGGDKNLPRTHSRSYLFLGVEGRYYPVHYKFFEAWVGPSAGAVVVADRFTTEAGDRVPPILGVPEVTIRTEGLALGAQGGGNYWLTENWILGAALRAHDWVLPTHARCSSIGDCSTLQGHVLALSLGITIAYRLPL